jgi:hypothetical protein
MINDLFPFDGARIHLQDRELVRTTTIDCMAAVSKPTSYTVEQLYVARVA